MANLFGLFFHFEQSHCRLSSVLRRVENWVMLCLAVLLLLLLSVAIVHPFFSGDLTHLREDRHLHLLLQVIHHGCLEHKVEVVLGVYWSGKLVCHCVLVIGLVVREGRVSWNWSMGVRTWLRARLWQLWLSLMVQDSNIAWQIIDRADRRIAGERILRFNSIYLCPVEVHGRYIAAVVCTLQP